MKKTAILHRFLAATLILFAFLAAAVWDTPFTPRTLAASGETATAESEETAIPHTVLPKKSADRPACKEFPQYLNIVQSYRRDGKEAAEIAAAKNQARTTYAGYSRRMQYDILACALKSGRFHLFMVPYMIRYFVEFVIRLAGILCVLFMVIGAYQYLIGTVTENKQKGKDTIKNALIGLVITLLSWIIVNVVQVAVTGGSQ